MLANRLKDLLLTYWCQISKHTSRGPVESMPRWVRAVLAAKLFAAGYTMDAWERWRIVCLAALSVVDIEDIYLFGTMITGILLIGLGFALGYRRIQKTGTAVQSLTRLPVMIEAVGRAVSIETETINRNMDSIMEKLTALQRKIDIGDQNGQRE